ncbi:hypothetical protein [Pyramidobacter sp. CG50-2]|uniref:hypothetical protein n=1 Tax=Pyramidobacter sp. CG50-2 TaxID=2382160 RepID=UPI0011C42D8D|nr:hypothetical protein [Pyramidobacter sp. CG50-2]
MKVFLKTKATTEKRRSGEKQKYRKNTAARRRRTREKRKLFLRRENQMTINSATPKGEKAKREKCSTWNIFP